VLSVIRAFTNKTERHHSPEFHNLRTHRCVEVGLIHVSAAFMSICTLYVRVIYYPDFMILYESDEITPQRIPYLCNSYVFV